MAQRDINVFTTPEGAAGQVSNYSGMSNSGRDAMEAMGGMDPNQILQMVMQAIMGILKMSG
jgi:hypothetical protein